MSNKKVIIKDGLFSFLNRGKKAKRGLDLTKFIESEFSDAQIPHIVPCCACPAAVPMRINVTEDGNVIEHWDCETEAWIPTIFTVESARFVDGEIVNLSVNSIVTNAPSTVISQGSTLHKHAVTVAKDVTGSVTAIELSGGHITSTSAAAVSLTMPTVASLVTQMGAVAGDCFQFVINNSAGANTITLDLTGSGMVTGTSPITGGATLTVSTANVIGVFELVFTSGTAAVIRRVI